MNPADELALIRQHVRRIEADLALARQQLVDLEKRLPAAETAPALAAALTMPPPAAEGEARPIVVPLTPEPPPLPPPPPVPSPVEPPRPAREFVPAEEPAASASPWREWLTALQLWPPAGEGDAEVRLGAWWATRIGAALAVIGVVLFGVYVSVNTPPWVKFAELAAVSAGLTAAGWWWERRTPRFGAVVFSAGLALLYFCAFAAHALPPVKVIEGVLPAALWQLAAVVGLVATAVIRRSSSIAAMAVGFGFVTAIFSRFGGLDELALAMAGLLALASVGLHRRLRWEAPSVLALPGSYAVLAAVWLGSWRPVGAADPWWAWGSLLAFALAFFLRDWPRGPRAGEITRGERWFQGTNAGLALLIGTGIALTAFRPQLAWFYLAAAGLCALLGEARRRESPADVMAPVFFAKASGALALGIVELAEGRTVALALLAQAWVLYLISGYLRSRLLSAVTALTLAAAWVFQIAGVRTGMAAGSVGSLGSVLFVAGFAWLASATIRRLPGAAGRQGLEVLAGFAAFCAAGLAILQGEPRGWLPLWALSMATVLGAVAWSVRALGATLASAGLLLLAHFLVVAETVGSAPRHDYLVNGLGVVVVSLALGWWLGGPAVARLAEARERIFRIAGDLVCGLATLTLAAVLFRWLGLPGALVALYGVAFAWAGLSTGYPARKSVWLCVWTVAVAVGGWGGRIGWPVDRAGLGAVLVCAWLLPFATRLWPRLRETIARQPGADFVEPLLVAAAAWLTFRLLPWIVPSERLLLFPAVAVVLAVGSWRSGLRSGLAASWLIWVMAWLASLEVLGRSDGFSRALPPVAAGVLAWLPAVLLARVHREGTPLAWWTSHGANLQAALAALFSAWLAIVGWRDANALLALLGAAGVAWACRRIAPLPVAGAAVAFLLGLAGVRTAALAMAGGLDGPGMAWAIGLVVCVCLAGLPWLMNDPAQTSDKERRAAIAWIAGAAALGLAFLIAVVQRGSLGPYATVGWGLSAILLFVAGLFVRLRPFRLLGLAGLLVCIPRIFLVDLQSAFHRIVAFVVLGGVLLWVGFSYHRFRHLIVDKKEES